MISRFASPLCFLLVAVVIARAVIRWRDSRAGLAAFPFSSLGLLGKGTTLRARTAIVPFLIESAAMLLVVVALARPQRIERIASNDRFGIDIVVALDASGSMAAEDFRPQNRFGVAKALIADFIERRVDDRIGIVIFGSRAATRVPITFDHDAAQAILGRARVGENGDGTAIGHAIATAVNRLHTSKSRSRIIILVTDGVNNAGSIEPLTAAGLAAKLGIRIYTVGVGSRGNVPIPVKMQNPFTGQIETVYQQIRADLDEDTLRAIATTTHGEYFRATDPKTFSTVLSRIDQLEKSRLTAPKTEKIDELYVIPLTAAILLLAVALLCGETFWLRAAA